MTVEHIAVAHHGFDGAHDLREVLTLEDLVAVMEEEGDPHTEDHLVALVEQTVPDTQQRLEERERRTYMIVGLGQGQSK